MIGHLAFLPDGRLLVARRDALTIGSGAPLPVRGTVLAVAPDGQTLVTASSGVVGIWSLPDGTLRKELVDPGASATCAAFTPGHLHTANGVDVKTWDLASGALVRKHKQTIKPGYGTPVGLVVTPNEDYAVVLYSGWRESMIIFYNRELDWSDRQWKHQEARALVSTSTPDHALVGGKRGFGLVLMNFVGFFAETTFADAGEVECVAITPDASRVVAGSGNEVVFWEGGTPAPVRRESHGAEVTRIAVSPTGHAASASADGVVRTWDP